MTLPTSGPLAISQMRTEFTGPTPSPMSSYYRGGSFVPNTGTNAAVPTSGLVKISNFYGASHISFTPVQHTHSSGSGTETIPSGATTVVIEVWGGGGGGGAQDTGPGFPGGGGASGAYSRSSFNVAAANGQTMNWSVGSGGAQAPNFNNNGSPGNQSSVSSGTFSIGSSIISGGGGGGGGAGSGGPVGSGGSTSFTASGNQAFNFGNAGSAGSAPSTGGAGGAAVTGVHGSGGAGGHGAGYPSGTGLSNGSFGLVIFYYT